MTFLSQVSTKCKFPHDFTAGSRKSSRIARASSKSKNQTIDPVIPSKAQGQKQGKRYKTKLIIAQKLMKSFGWFSHFLKNKSFSFFNISSNSKYWETYIFWFLTKRFSWSSVALLNQKDPLRFITIHMSYLKLLHYLLHYYNRSKITFETRAKYFL